ncbi:MAG: septal ring lytic transglycosylase RlpA family protein [Gammaproteobacteria bacterium]|nr:septal ring lytic transglycosylase RlpA family protein [Gammaproteobacteria bacterium]
MRNASNPVSCYTPRGACSYPFPTRLPLAVCCLLVAVLSACGTAPKSVVAPPSSPERPARDGAPANPPDLASLPEPVPRPEPRSRYGNPPSYTVYGKRYFVMESSTGYVERGTASWYGTKFHGQYTSSREPYDMYAFTAAHKTLPIPCYAQVTNLRNGRTLIVRINDRGPFVGDRLIDLSYAAASRLGILDTGTGQVEVRVIDVSTPASTAVAAHDRSIAALPQTSQSAPAAPTYLQMGAFQSRGNAERLRDTLLSKASITVQITEAPSPGGTLYRVRIGPVQSAEETDRLSGMLNQLGFSTPQVVID